MSSMNGVQALSSHNKHLASGYPDAEAYYGAVLNRIRRLIPVLSVIGGVVAWLRLGWIMGAGFALGGAVAYVNFQLLARVVNSIGLRPLCPQKEESKFTVITRFLLLYVVLAVVGYCIARSCLYSLYAMIGGLFTPAGAILCEGVYEAFGGDTRGGKYRRPL